AHLGERRRRPLRARHSDRAGDRGLRQRARAVPPRGDRAVRRLLRPRRGRGGRPERHLERPGGGPGGREHRMTPARALAATLAVVLALVLQVSLFPHLAWRGVVPNLVLLVVVAAALSRGPQFAMVLGFGG